MKKERRKNRSLRHAGLVRKTMRAQTDVFLLPMQAYFTPPGLFMSQGNTPRQLLQSRLSRTGFLIFFRLRSKKPRPDLRSLSTCGRVLDVKIRIDCNDTLDAVAIDPLLSVLSYGCTSYGCMSSGCTSMSHRMHVLTGDSSDPWSGGSGCLGGRLRGSECAICQPGAAVPDQSAWLEAQASEVERFTRTTTSTSLPERMGGVGGEVRTHPCWAVQKLLR